MVRYIPQSFEIISGFDSEKVLKLIELAGRTCYKSEDKISEDSYYNFIKMILSRGHLSVIEHACITVKIITNRGVTHELVRHRMASFSQESTRYCNYGKEKFGNEITVIDQSDFFSNDEQVSRWKKAMESSEKSYMSLIESGVPPQIARGVLPIDLKTEIIITANLREWRHIFELRTSPAAHPNIRSLMKSILTKFKKAIPVIFDDI
ncbi:MAG: FAD-dependent thymidylate synthase [Promethearchaeota archaeon]